MWSWVNIWFTRILMSILILIILSLVNIGFTTNLGNIDVATCLLKKRYIWWRQAWTSQKMKTADGQIHCQVSVCRAWKAHVNVVSTHWVQIFSKMRRRCIHLTDAKTYRAIFWTLPANECFPRDGHIQSLDARERRGVTNTTNATYPKVARRVFGKKERRSGRGATPPSKNLQSI